MQESTVIQYNSIMSAFFKRYERETSYTWQDDPIKFSNWIIKVNENCSSSTWRLRKNAITFCLEPIAPAEAVNLIRNLKFIEKDRKGLPLVTSQKKTKRIKTADFELLLRSLVKSDRTYDVPLGIWLNAGLLIGARPCEWYGAVLNKNEIILPCAKFNEERSCGKTRTIHFLEAFDSDGYINIKAHVDRVNSFESKQQYTDFYDSCRRRLWSVNHKIWPGKEKNITLYSPRHQFSANAKKVGSPIIVAAMMGHRSSMTATEHYCRSEHGDPSMIQVEPDERNIALVKDDARTYEDHAKKLKQKSIVTK